MTLNNPKEVAERDRNKIRGLQYELSGHEDALQSIDLLVKELDAAWNGDDVAEAPQLCDLVLQIKTERTHQKSVIRGLLNLLRAVWEMDWLIPELEKFGWTGLDLQDEKATFNSVKEVINNRDYNIAGSIEFEINALTKERDEFKRLYDHRGKALMYPCSHCGKVPNRIKLTGKTK